MFFVIFWTALVRYTWLSNSSRFFPTISTFGCFWSQWPTSLAVTSGREGVRTTSFKPWRPHRGSCRGATAIEENNGSRRERCGAGGCRREATWINHGHFMSFPMAAQRCSQTQTLPRQLPTSGCAVDEVIRCGSDEAIPSWWTAGDHRNA